MFPDLCLDLPILLEVEGASTILKSQNFELLGDRNAIGVWRPTVTKKSKGSGKKAMKEQTRKVGKKKTKKKLKKAAKARQQSPNPHLDS